MQLLSSSSVKLLNTNHVFVITETKLGDSVPTNQFHLEGFSTPYRQDRNRLSILKKASKITFSQNTPFMMTLKAFLLKST